MDWGIDETVTRLMTEGKIRPTMVVAMWSTDIRVAEYMPQKLPHTLAYDGSYADDSISGSRLRFVRTNYLRFIVEEIKAIRGWALSYSARAAG